MKNATNATIAALAVTACILIAMVVLFEVSTPAYAGNTPAAGGDYLMITAPISGNRDALYIVDMSVEKMNVYIYDYNKKVLSLDDQLDLKKEFK